MRHDITGSIYRNFAAVARLLERRRRRRRRAYGKCPKLLPKADKLCDSAATRFGIGFGYGYGYGFDSARLCDICGNRNAHLCVRR